MIQVCCQKQLKIPSVALLAGNALCPGLETGPAGDVPGKVRHGFRRFAGGIQDQALCVRQPVCANVQSRTIKGGTHRVRNTAATRAVSELLSPTHHSLVFVGVDVDRMRALPRWTSAGAYAEKWFPAFGLGVEADPARARGRLPEAGPGQRWVTGAHARSTQ